MDEDEFGRNLYTIIFRRGRRPTNVGRINRSIVKHRPTPFLAETGSDGIHNPLGRIASPLYPRSFPASTASEGGNSSGCGRANWLWHTAQHVLTGLQQVLAL